MDTPTTPAPKKKSKKSGRPSRAYKGTDAQMLTVCLVQVRNAQPIQEALADRREDYTPKYLTDLEAEVETALEKDLGLNPRIAVQLLTGELTTAQASVLGYLRSFNLDLTDSFVNVPDKKRLAELRALLGLRDHYTAAQNSNQSALAELLATFTTALDSDPALLPELQTQRKISAKLIANIQAQSQFYQRDAAQEQAKSSVPTITDATILRFNSLYRRVQAVARLARDLSRGQAAEVEKHSYSTLRRRLTGGAGA